ncbi:MAG: hypothetical protein AAB433_22665 [Nitrospirota bacterium]
MSQPIPRVERQPISLATGTSVGLSSVPLGRGNLRIVNGTPLDALVKLGAYAEDGRPQASLYVKLYVKAGEEFTINDIGEGAYRLVFSLGIDWDQATEGFRKDKAFTMFDEPFEFKEIREVEEISEGEKRGTRTRIKFVEAVATLHAVLDGHAKTSSIDEQAFDRLFEDRD